MFEVSLSITPLVSSASSMYLCTLSPKQASVLLPFLLCLSIQVLASELERRVIGSCPDDENGDEASTLDGLTSDKSAGSE